MRVWLGRHRKTFRRFGVVAVTTALLSLGVWLTIRHTLLDRGWKIAQNAALSKGYTLQCKSMAFDGLFHIQVQGLALTMEGKPLLQIQETQAAPSFIALLQGKPRLRKLHLLKVAVHLLNTSSGCNYRNLINTDQTIAKAPKPVRSDGESQRIYRAVSAAMDWLPSDFKLLKLKADYSTDTGQWVIHIPHMLYQGERIDGSLNIKENGCFTGFAFDGHLDRSDITGQIRLRPYARGNSNLRSTPMESGLSRVVLPLTLNRWGLSAQMKEVNVQVRQFKMTNGVLAFDLEGDLQSLQLMHPKLAVDTVLFPRCRGRLRGNVRAHQVEFDSTSGFQIQQIPCRFYMLWDRGPQARLDLRITTSKISANRFLGSLPIGIFRNLQGMKAQGRLHWFLSLQLEDRQPERCRFRSALVSDQFRITRMGVTNLAKMNGAFAHTVTQNGVYLRNLWVGPENPMYTPLQQIPVSMQQAIMTGEDGDFYHHQGFYPEAFRRSIAQNYRKGKFARGGSTITMQLVKNVFLNPRKTIARKAEELLITWIIENQGITSKARMMEVYLNVIEFGSNVWGIGEASRYYFGKHPSALDPIESVFLAGLVPRPRVFQNLLEPDGTVSSKNGNFIAIRNRFVRRGLLPQEDSNRVHVGLLRSVYRHLQPMDSATLAKELLDVDFEDY